MFQVRYNVKKYLPPENHKPLVSITKYTSVRQTNRYILELNNHTTYLLEKWDEFGIKTEWLTVI